MQQILTVLSAGADAVTIANTVESNSGAFHSFLAATVVIVDGDENVQNALNALIPSGAVIGTLSDDVARGLVTFTDISQLDIPGMATLISNAGLAPSPDEPTILPIAAWIYGLSQQYADKKSDRPREGEPWDIEGGCLPTD